MMKSIHKRHAEKLQNADKRGEQRGQTQRGQQAILQARRGRGNHEKQQCAARRLPSIFHIRELTKFTKTEHELKTILEKWLFFLKYADRLEVIPDNADTIALRAAYGVADKFGWTQDELEVYDYWGIKEQDERGAVEYAMRIGLQQGVEQGIQQGIQRGEQRKAMETARKMLAKGYAMQDICELTGLTAEEMAALDEKTP